MAVDHFGLDLTYIDQLLTKICAKNYLYIFVLTALDISPLDLKCSLLQLLLNSAFSLN